MNQGTEKFKEKVELLLKNKTIKEVPVNNRRLIELCQLCYFKNECERKKGMPCMSTVRNKKESAYYVGFDKTII